MQAKAFASFAQNPEQEADYYILSLDGGGIRGVLTAAFLDRMEDLAYQMAVAEGRIPDDRP